MASPDKCPPQRLLEVFVADSIKRSSKTLTVLQGLTGIHRSTLGRMRLGRCPVSFDEAKTVFRALNRPSYALFMLAWLGEEGIVTDEVLGYLEHFLSNLPELIERLNELGPSLNPKWAVGSVHHLASLMVQHADRIRHADTFHVPSG